MRQLTVLYDAYCPFCSKVKAWLAVQPQLVPLEFLAAASEEAQRRYPDLDPAATLRDVTVVADDGSVYTGPAAWVTILWALREYRAKSITLAKPGMAPFARAAVATASKIRAVTAPPRPGSGIQRPPVPALVVNTPPRHLNLPDLPRPQPRGPGRGPEPDGYGRACDDDRCGGE
ncbi:thiol-disulfide oxidoreductase DCC family protein [Longispora albida]|uniref:thiol-disulfide oxidoreductase DCC family protein n=1 Tax=Longispora albida TaxID=203523 RepID=UPI000371C934|nr:DCC1-like thiol-disulfide oxidoreductase family protein [Longispora albida]